MIEIINPVLWIRHIKKTDITSLRNNDAGQAFLISAGHRTVPFSKGSATGSIQLNYTPAGKVWETQINAYLESKPAEFEQGIFLVKLESGETLIIGDLDFPAKGFINETLSQKSLEISHSSWHYPFMLAV